ncbi:MARCKS-related protein [Heterocephalus glaber]|uniref:MARCKS-related protein n=1 Tax=Heterocephalus glaber TaxID=10181 RepID=G5B5L6_HETGA|nr:MARCKS-related protein [Heterocephalus glaber]
MCSRRAGPLATARARTSPLPISLEPQDSTRKFIPQGQDLRSHQNQNRKAARLKSTYMQGQPRKEKGRGQRSSPAILTLPLPPGSQENGHVKSNGDLSPKGEGESPPVNGTDEADGATGDAIEPAPPSQGAEAKGEAPPKETPKKKKKFSFKKPFKLSGLSFKRNRKEGGGDSSASSPTEEEQEQGEIGACSEEGTAQEGKAAATPESQEPQAKGAEASAAAKGGDAEEEAGPQAAEPSTPSGPESDPAPASTEQNE